MRSICTPDDIHNTPMFVPHDYRGDVMPMTSYYIMSVLVKYNFGALDSALGPMLGHGEILSIEIKTTRSAPF